MLTLPFLHMLYHVVCRTAIQTWRNRKQAALRKSLFSECALRKIHLRGFETAVTDSNPLALMTSYNQLNGAYTGCNRNLVTHILRCEWGYKDFVMTDRGTKYNPAAALHAQVDMTMPGCDAARDAVLAGLTDGSIPQLHCICERATQKEQASRRIKNHPLNPVFVQSGALTPYNPAKRSKRFCCTTTSAAFLLWSAHFVDVTAVRRRHPLPPAHTIR